GFAIAFGIRHTEVTLDSLLGITTFLRSHKHDLVAVKACHSAKQRRIVSEAPVAVNLAPVRKDALYIVKEVGSLGVPRKLSFLPRTAHGIKLIAQALHLPVKLVKLLLGFEISPGNGFQVRDLPLNVFDVFSGSGSCVHEWERAEGERRSVNDLNAATAAEFLC